MKRKIKIAAFLTMLLFLAFILSCESFNSPTSSDNFTPTDRSLDPVMQGSDVELIDNCETAFGKGCWIYASSPKANPENLPSLNLSKLQWGWAINFMEDGEYIYEIWAAAGKNDITKGFLAGTLTIVKSGLDVTVNYSIDPGFIMSEVHIYANDLMPMTISPGLLGHTVEFDPGVYTYEHTFTIDDENGDGIWIIAHAVVCTDEMAY